MGNKVCDLIEISGIADILPINPTNFKQLSVQETVTIPAVKPDAEQIVSVSAVVVIKSTNLITTPVGTSLDGQILTGKKLVVEGAVVQKIEYVADESTQSVHAVHVTMPFSTYIVMPAGYTEGTPVTVTGYIEDVYIKLICKRKIFKNITILLDARY